ncbi:MAG: error-prone DNA polymerase [Gammaproteobacteria bacterium]|nr:error-prone DNA polymerase [Gammaproteobacteria bacterium]
MPPDYVELHALSNFSFLRGASHPGELVQRAAELGYAGLALTDECSLAGAVRAHQAATDYGDAFRLILGSELRLEDGLRLVLLVPDRAAWGALSRLITAARRAAPKGRYRLARSGLEEMAPGCLALYLPDPEPARRCEQVGWFRDQFGERGWLAVELLAGDRDPEHLAGMQDLSRHTGLPLVAAGDVHMHLRTRRPLQDTLTAIRLGTTVDAAGNALFPNGERCLRNRQRLAGSYPAELLAETLHIAARCDFRLDSLRYEYPRELVPDGHTARSWLAQRTAKGMRRRWPEGAPAPVRAQVDHELRLIAELEYEPFFLTVEEIVRYARSRNILCQGRGSAANSAVCYCLGITEVDPARMEMLFERFVSKERNEPPDIDVDFEHDRREEVIQHIYAKYGRERAALAATVITYRARSAVRDVGKALGLEPEQVERLAGGLHRWNGRRIEAAQLAENGFDPFHPRLARVMGLVQQLIGFPRHLSQHVGGFVIARDLLEELVPIENAAMPGRTVIQWDKDDLETLGLLKVDCLGLGMLSAIHRALDLIATRRGRPFGLQDIPAEDPAVYAMIQEADTLGVFQIESRAQMAMLPRLKPACFYDLVIEVAIIRPGPIQGDMVHPYLRRRQGREPVSYPSDEVRDVLERTLGVPIFQEQVIKLAMVAAGFTPGEADHLRRSMAAWKRHGGLEPFEQRLVEGMRRRGYQESFARQIFQQILGFGEYGFPESHSASFALLVYVSAWLKCHQPAAYCCALLNSQPMGFYAPAQLVSDARHHGVRVLPVDVCASDRDCTLEGDALRLGLRLVKGLSRKGAARLVAARRQQAFAGLSDLRRRARPNAKDLQALADADALAALAGNRRQASWQVLAPETAPLDGLPLDAPMEGMPMLRPPSEGENIAADYASLGLSLGRHPLALLRPRLDSLGWCAADALHRQAHGRHTRTGGLVICRQRPSSASGVIFLTLEDETGYSQIIVWPRLAKQQQRELLGARLIGIQGVVQKEGRVLHVIAHRIEDHSALLGTLRTHSRDFA